jgi:hypothetical protein
MMVHDDFGFKFTMRMMFDLKKMKNNEEKCVTCSWSNSKIMHEKNAK